jgi:hypothetical protein
MKPDTEAYRRKAAEILNQAYQNALQTRERAILTAEDLVVGAAEKGRFRIEDPDNNLEAARERIQSGDSMIVYFGPHIGGLPPDIGTVARAIQPIIPQDRTAIYTAQKHLDPERGEGRLGRTAHKAQVEIVERASATRGFKIIPGVHTAEDIEYYATHRDAIGGMDPVRFSAKAVEQGANFLLEGNPEDGGNALVIAPGGSRDSQAKLTQAQKGLEFTLKRARRNTFAVALALEPNVRKNVPIFGHITVRPGVPMSWEDIDDKYVSMQQEALANGSNLGMTRSDLMMTYLASMLPAKHQGFYRAALTRFPNLSYQNWNPQKS